MQDSQGDKAALLSLREKTTTKTRNAHKLIDTGVSYNVSECPNFDCFGFLFEFGWFFG